MQDPMDLKLLERRAFRATHQDGLWDIYIGGIVLSMAALAYSDADEAFPLVRFGLFLLGLGLSFLIYWGGRKYITTPRLGQVRFGQARQRRKRTMIIVLSGIVGVQVLLLAGTVALWQNPHWAAGLGLIRTDQERERLLVALVGALFVGPSTALIAYFNDFLRGYYISVVMALAVFALIWFGQPIYMVIAGLLIVLPGGFFFVRFLRKYPQPSAGISHE